MATIRSAGKRPRIGRLDQGNSTTSENQIRFPTPACSPRRMLGLGRPRLKARASLLDLITAKHTLTQPSPPAELPPLPDSPSSTTFTHSVSTHSTQASSIMTSGNSEHHGSIFSVSGPVVVAENMIGCAMYELVGYPSSEMVENSRY